MDGTGLRKVVFVEGASRGRLDRGWNPLSVSQVLADWSVPTERVSISDAGELASIVEAREKTIYWPLSYNFDGRAEGHDLFDALDALRVPRVGALKGADLTSKLNLKAQAAKAGIKTPSWWTLSEFVERPIDDGRYFVKSDLSCDSKGVAPASAVEVLGLAKDLVDSLGHEVFVEADAGRVEWTASCIALDGRIVKSAAIQMIPHGAYLDASTKIDNSELDMVAVPHGQRKEFEQTINHLVTSLGLTGYFRIDFVGELPDVSVIDVNVLPGLTGPGPKVSYFPEAFRIHHGWSFERVIAEILGAAIEGAGEVNPTSQLADFLGTQRTAA